ncbi:MAG: tryptophan 2,3-dioxygenase family protein [Pseudomonadota bacterium]
MRKLEPGIHTDLARRKSYGGYLQLDKILSAQAPLSSPAHHDEMLFIIQHQVAELWFKLMIHELEALAQAFREDRLHRAQKTLLRVKRIQHQMIDQWSVLNTLTPSEYAEFRHVFGDASGFQSPQYRLVEFLLGNRNAALAELHKHSDYWYTRLKQTLSAPSVYDEFLISMCRQGFDIPEVCTERDFSHTRDVNTGVVRALKAIYNDPETHWPQYEICESMMDVANNFQLWRFSHMKSVERVIGHKRGTGGSSGVSFLKRAMDEEFFPELIQVRTEIGR